MEMVTWILNTSLGNDSCLLDFHGDWDSFICLKVNGPSASKYQLSLALNTWLLSYCSYFCVLPRPLLLHSLGKPCPIPVSRYTSVPTPCTWAFPLKSESESEVAQLYLTLCDSVDCSPPGFSVHGILQARILEWVAISFSRGSSRPQGSKSWLLLYGWILYHWTTMEAQRLVRRIK